MCRTSKIAFTALAAAACLLLLPTTLHAWTTSTTGAALLRSSVRAATGKEFSLATSIRRQHHAALSSLFSSAGNEGPAPAERANSPPEAKKSLLQRIRDGAKMDKKKLGSLGLYALLSYGFVSNASYAVGIGVAWYLASVQSGLSPLAPGQWKAFLAVWASVFVFNNVIRPARFALAVALAPSFDRFIALIMRKTGRNKTVATGICVFLVNVCGTITLMSSGIILASIFSGVPIWAK